MTGRVLMWVGWVTVAGSVVGLGVYFAVAGFHLVDVVGVIGAVVGVVGLVLAVYGLVLARRDTTTGPGTGPGTGPAGGIGAGGVHNTFSGGTAYGPVVMGRDISGSVYGSAAPPAAPPVSGEGAGERPDRASGGAAGESQH